MTVFPGATVTLTQHSATAVSLGNSTTTLFTAVSTANVQTIISGIFNCASGSSGGSGSSTTTLYAGPSVGSVATTHLGVAAAATGATPSTATTNTTCYNFETNVGTASINAQTRLFSFILMPGHSLIVENLDPGTGTAGSYTYSIQKMEIDYNT